MVSENAIQIYCKNWISIKNLFSFLEMMIKIFKKKFQKETDVKVNSPQQ
jgi:hypothetical protein